MYSSYYESNVTKEELFEAFAYYEDWCKENNIEPDADNLEEAETIIDEVLYHAKIRMEEVGIEVFDWMKKDDNTDHELLTYTSNKRDRTYNGEEIQEIINLYNKYTENVPESVLDIRINGAYGSIEDNVSLSIVNIGTNETLFEANDFTSLSSATDEARMFLENYDGTLEPIDISDFDDVNFEKIIDIAEVQEAIDKGLKETDKTFFVVKEENGSHKIIPCDMMQMQYNGVRVYPLEEAEVEPFIVSDVKPLFDSYEEAQNRVKELNKSFENNGIQ